jgi:hypothetical protein
MSTPEQSLEKGESGAIMVVGIVMGAILVGAIWHIASVGDAIIWRERAQDAADSAAFEAAAWNARGMNVLVLINIVMSLVMAILVLWRMAMIFLSVIVGIISISCLVSIFLPNPATGAVCTVGGPRLPWFTEKLIKMKNKDDEFSVKIINILSGMSMAQKVVSTATPIVGALATADDTNDAYEVNAGFAATAALFPTVERLSGKPFTACKDRSPNPSADDFVQKRLGVVFSLPSQEDRFAVLCQKGGEFLPNQIAGFLERMGFDGGAGFIDAVGGVIGAITGSLPGVFCTPGATAIPQEIKDTFAGAAKNRCEEKKRDSRVFVTDSNGVSVEKWPKEGGNPGEYVDEFDMDDCMTKASKRAEIEGLNGRKPDCARPFKVWEYATNGNVAMQAFSWVEKEPRMLSRNDRGLDVADGPRLGNVTEAETGWTRAQAEMFYDCTGPWAQGQCMMDSAWAIRWKARLRRIQPLDQMIAEAGEAVVVNSVVSGLYRIFGKMTKNLARSKLGMPDILTTNLADTWLTNELIRKRAREAAFRSDAFENVGNFLVRNPPSRSTVIH